MRNVAVVDNVVPFRRPAGTRKAAEARVQQPRGGERADQRNLMDLVYATGSFLLAAEDRDTKLVASRLQVYGFLVIEEVAADGTLRRLRPSEAIRAQLHRPWRLSKASFGTGPSVTIPTVDGFLFDQMHAPLGA